MKLNDVDLNKLLTFLAIAEANGVAAAARQLALSRSAVSHSLGSLEEALGVSLFHRVGKSMVLTREGKKLRSAASEVRNLLGDAIADLAGEASEPRGPVRVGLFVGFPRLRLAGVIGEFARAHPGARVRVAFASQTWLVDELLAGRLDMTLSLRPTREQTPHVKSEKLLAQSLVLAIRAPRKPGRVDFESVRRLPIVDYYPGDPLIDRWTRHHFAGKRVPRAQIRVWAASTDLAIELVLKGVGAAVLPEDVVESFLERKQLVVLAGRPEPLRDHVWLNALRSRRRALAPEAFRKLLLNRFRDASASTTRLPTG